MKKEKRTSIFVALGGAMALLPVFAAIIWAQAQYRPSTLTPSRESAPPGASIRIGLSPVIGSSQAEGMRMVLRPTRAQGPDQDVVLRIQEYHGDWLQVQIPRDVSPDLGSARFLLLNPSGDVLASSFNRLFRVVGVTPPAPTNPVPTGGGDPRASKDEVRAKTKMTTPGVAAQAREAQSMTTPGVSAQAKRIPTPVTDYVAIGMRDMQLRDRVPFLSVFNLPADVRLDGPAVLMFMANPEEGAIITTLSVSINGHEVKDIRFHGDGVMHARCISFNARGVLLAGRNEIVFERSGQSLSIDDIVLWFHRDIEW